MSSIPDLTSSSAMPAPGSIVAGYRVEEVLGRGGMGVVVRARHERLGEAVALKFLHARTAEEPEKVERFLREARAAVRIKSEHVARIIDVGTLPDGAPFLVMELLEGQDLGRVSHERGPLPVGEAVDYVVQACRAITDAHQHGIVHRDLKPPNLFLTRRRDGSAFVKVLDFGISKVTDGSEQGLTATGAVLGSPLYMAPEQIRDPRRADARSDIWSLGNILFKLLAGRAAFEAQSPSGTLARILVDPTPSLSAARPDVPPAIDAIVARCLQKAPEHRFQSVDELANALVLALGAVAWARPPAMTPHPPVVAAPPTVTSPAPPSPPPPAPFAIAPAPAAQAREDAEATTAYGSAMTRPPPRASRRAAALGLALSLAVVVACAFAARGMLSRAARDRALAATAAPAASTAEASPAAPSAAPAPTAEPSAAAPAESATATQASPGSSAANAPAPRTAPARARPVRPPVRRSRNSSPR